MDLIKWILIALVKLLPTQINPLILPQTRLLLFDLRQASGLIRRIRRPISPLRMAVDLCIITRGGKRESVQRILNPRRIERRALARPRPLIVKLRQVQRALGFLLVSSSLRVALALRGQRRFFRRELCVTFRFLARRVRFLRFCVFPTSRSSIHGT